MGVYKCRVLVKKSPAPQFDVRLREMSVSGGSTVLKIGEFLCLYDQGGDTIEQLVSFY